MLEKQELLNITGGSSSWLSSTFLNSLARVASTLAELGRNLGSAIRRYLSGSMCSAD